MGRKSRRKKLNRHVGTVGDVGSASGLVGNDNSNIPTLQHSNILIEVIRWGAYIALFAPLVVSSKFLFPFVVTKTVFFWIFAEFIFAAWILLALNNKRFRPRWNALTISVGAFIFVTILTSFTGVNIERSFWSTVERMAGAVNWIHLAIFFFVLSATFKSVKDWKKLLAVSLMASVIVALIFLLERLGISIIGFNTKGGSTIGNSSFMSAYLLFNVFFGIWLFSQAKDFVMKVVYATAVFLLALTIFLSTAFGAFLSMAGGFFLLFIAWLFFKKRVNFAKPLAVIFLMLGIIIGSVIIYATFAQDEQILKRLPSFFASSETIQARKVVWQMAVEGIKERPILGWGPENFNVPFSKYFNPCLALNECGNEVWFDRTHNIVLDHLANSGIVGLISYLAILLSALFLAWKKIFRGSKDWIFPTVITSLLISYVAQNMLVFDMLNTYLMFALTLAFAQSLSAPEFALVHSGFGGPKEEETDQEISNIRSPGMFSVFIVGTFLIYYLFSFGVQSLEAAYLGIKIGRGKMQASEILKMYRKSLTVSPVGNRQIPEFFTQQIMKVAESDSSAPNEFVQETINIMEDMVEKNPLDYREKILLANLYTAAHQRDSAYLLRSEELLKESLELSPKNQQSYFSLVENYMFQGRGEEALEMAQKAVALEPRFKKAYQFLSRAYENLGERELAQEALDRAAEF